MIVANPSLFSVIGSSSEPHDCSLDYGGLERQQEATKLSSLVPPSIDVKLINYMTIPELAKFASQPMT
jgi:hypothetical protein